MVINYLHTVHLTARKTNMISTEVKNLRKKLSVDQRKHATELNNFEKKKILSLTNRQEKIQKT